MNRRYRRWLGRQPKVYRDMVEDNHRVFDDLLQRHLIEKALDGVEAKIATDQDATEALHHFYAVTEGMK